MPPPKKKQKKEQSKREAEDEDETESFGECETAGLVLEDVNGKKKFYTSVTVNNLVVKIGDFVKVRLSESSGGGMKSRKSGGGDDEDDDDDDDDDDGGDDEDDEDDVFNYGYCQILAIYDDKVEGVCVEVRWFNEAWEIFEKVKKLGLDLHDNELIECDRLDDIPAGVIVDHIIIEDVPTDPQIAQLQLHSQPFRHPKFVCRYMEKRSSNSFMNISMASCYARGMDLSEYRDSYSSLEGAAADDLMNDPYSQAMRKLHISMLPATLPCRSQEMEIVTNYIRTAVISKGVTKPVYISGMPGVGKTATIKASIAALKKEVSTKNVPAFEFVEINCLQLQTPADAYSVLWRSIYGEHVSSKKALRKLTEYFNISSNDKRLSQSRPVTICLLDEVDFLLTRDANIIYNFYDWPNTANSNLVVISVSNAMDLPERLSRRVASRFGMQFEKRVFLPYTHNQVQEILLNRLREVNLPANVFTNKSMEFMSRKAAAAAGDLRSALKICQKTIEIFRQKQASAQAKEITVPMVNEAVNDYKQSPLIATVNKACGLDKAIMVSICKICNVTGLTRISLENVWERLSDFFDEAQKDPLITLKRPPYPIFRAAIDRLITQGLLKRQKANKEQDGLKVFTNMTDILTLTIEVTEVYDALCPTYRHYGGWSSSSTSTSSS